MTPWMQPLGSVETETDPSAFPGFLEIVLRLVPEGHTPIFGLEDTGGLGRSLAAFLIEAGYLVKDVNPIRSDRARNQQPHPDKSDPQDARAIAKVLLTDFDHLPNAVVDPLAKALAQVVRHRSSFVREQTQLKNQLHALLHEQFPRYQRMFKNPFSKAALAFWERFPSPQHLQQFGVKRLANFLRKASNNTVSTKRAEEILALISKNQKPTLDQQTRDLLVRTLVQRLNGLQEPIAALEKELERLLQQSDQQLQTLHGASTVTAATILANVRDPRRFRSASQFARYCGIAPQEYSSGSRTRHNQSQRGCRELNAALYRIALCQIGRNRNGEARNPIARQYFERKIAEGKTKKHALTCLARRLCDIIFAMMRDETPYKPRARRSQAA